MHVGAVGFDPQSASILYLGSERGVFRSGDGGETFRSVSPARYIAAVAPAPSNPAIVYAPFHPHYRSVQSGLLKSTDRGLTWTTVPTSFPDSLRFTKAVVDPADPDVLYLVSGADRFIPGALPSLWKSADGGATWNRLGQGLGNAWDLAIDPVEPATLYATVYTGTPRVSWSGSLWKSTDAGATWTLKANRTGCVRVHRDRPGTVWLIDPNRNLASSQSGCWWSQDGGDTWSQRSAMSGWDGGWQSLDWAYGGGAYGIARVIGQDLSDPEVLYWAGWQFVFASFDGGGRFENLFTREAAPGTWTSRGIENVAVTAVAISEADPSRIFTGYYDLGMWRSTNGGASWQPCNPVAFTGAWKGHGGCATSIVPDPARADVVFAVLGERADLATVVKSAGGGQASSWVAADGGLPAGFVYGLSLDRNSPAAQRTLFVTVNGDVYRSADDGATWSPALTGASCRVTAVDRFDASLVYAGGEGGLWRSTAGGAAGSWTRIGPAAFGGSNPKTLAEVQWEGIHRITPDPQTSGRVHVAVFGPGRGVFRSLDRGDTWSALRVGSHFRDVAVDPSNPEILYATSSHAYKAGGTPVGSEGVLRSQDGGRSWRALNDGLTWPFAGPIALDPGKPTKVIVGSPGGGFWIRNVEPPTVALAVSPQTGLHPLTVFANASASADADGTIASYHFDFGDGATRGPQTSPTVSHLYTSGHWTLTVTVTDDDGLKTSRSASVLVAPVLHGINLVANSSFETHTTGWGPYGSSTLLRVGGGFAGSYALRVAAPAGGKTGFGVNDSPNVVRVTGAAGEPYRFTAWVRSALHSGTCRLQVTEYQGLVPLASEKSAGVVLSPSWQMLTLDYSARAAGTTLDFRVVDSPLVANEAFNVDAIGVHLLSSTVAVGDLASAPPPLQPVLAPSPLGPGSELAFATTRAGPLEIGIHDLTGRRVRDLRNEREAPAGLHRVAIDGRDDRNQPLPSGVYFYRIRAAEGVAAGRFVIAR